MENGSHISVRITSRNSILLMAHFCMLIMLSFSAINILFEISENILGGSTYSFINICHISLKT